MAQSVKTDASWGRTAQTLAGPNYAIPQTIGKIAGNNLFHSFDAFNIKTGESAVFSTTTATLQNVISRVSGGGASSINGKLQLVPAAGSAPAFFFINPAGVTFGAGATVDVPGAFHVSTAQYIKFPDGNLYADAAATSTFSSANPVAFGFLGTSRAAIKLSGGTVLNPAQLQPLSLVAGDIIIDNAIVSTRSGDLRVVAFGQRAGEVPFAGSVAPASGDLSVVNAGQAATSALGANDGGAVYASAENMSLLNGGQISSTISSGGRGGSITVDAGTLAIDRQTSLLATAGITNYVLSGGTGTGGDIAVNVAGDLSIANGGRIGTRSSAAGNAGQVSVAAGNLSIDGAGANYFTGIRSDSYLGGTGNGGYVSVKVAGKLSITNSGKILSATYADGNAGAIDVAAGNLTIDSLGSETSTGIANDSYEGATGNTGSVAATVLGKLSLANAGNIRTSTYTAGNAGNIDVTAGTLSIDGAGASYAAGIFSSSESGATGAAGAVSVKAADNLSIVNGGAIYSRTDSVANAGGVRVLAGSLTIDDSWIYSAAGSDATGAGGNVSVNVMGDLSITNGGRIGTIAYTAADAGRVVVSAGSIKIDGSGSESYTGVFSSAESTATGRAGDVTVGAVGNVDLVNGGVISSNTLGSGNAGAVNVSARNLSIDGSGADKYTGIWGTSESGATGNAGDVVVNVKDALSIVDLGRIHADALGYSYGNAGRVTVSAGSLSIDGAGTKKYRVSEAITGISSNSRYGTSGNAGDVSVNVAGNLSVANLGRISADSGLSGPKNAGRVDVASGARVSIDGGFISADTHSDSGSAGSVNVSAASMTIDGGIDSIAGAGISADAGSFSAGKGGEVRVSVAGDLSMVNEGYIKSETFGNGNGGKVDVSARTLAIDGFWTRISSMSYGIGNAGEVLVSVADGLSISDEGGIMSDSSGQGNAGKVSVAAKTLSIAGVFSKISSTSVGGTGDAGNVSVSVADTLTISGSGSINSDTNTIGQGGHVDVSARNLTIFDYGSEISSKSGLDGLGNAGDVSVTVTNNLSIINGGSISSSTVGTGHAGKVAVSAGNLTIDGTDARISSSTDPSFGNAGGGNAGEVSVSVAETLSIVNHGAISSATSTGGHAGKVAVSAGNLIIDGIGARISSSTDSSYGNAGGGNAGEVSVSVAETLSIVNWGAISSATSTGGHAGKVTVSAGELSMDYGLISSSSSLNQWSGRSGGSAGDVSVTVANNLSIINGGSIASSTLTSGQAGKVTVSAGKLSIDGGNIQSASFVADGGDAGEIAVAVAGNASITRGGVIYVGTSGSGNAGRISVSAGNLSIDSAGVNYLTGISSQAGNGSHGNAGDVLVNVANNLSLVKGGVIEASTAGTGHGGHVRVRAGNLTISGGGANGGGIGSDVHEGSSGYGGNVSVDVAGDLSIRDGGGISAGTFGAGDAGYVSVNVAGNLSIKDQGFIEAGTGGTGSAGGVSVAARNILIDGTGATKLLTGISSNAWKGSSGNAGDVAVSASESIFINTRGEISSASHGAGMAGGVTVFAENLSAQGAVKSGSIRVSTENFSVDGYSGVFAGAGPGSAGQTGNVTITATKGITLSNGGILSIQNEATATNPVSIVPTSLTVSAPMISLQNAAITADSTGNVAASNVQVNFTDRLWLDPSSITTSANEGNGGSIRIQGGKLMVLDNSQITTSVLGASGNGGDIAVKADVLLMNTGFIQANTAAQAAAGGNVFIDVGALIPSGNTLTLGSRSAHAFAQGVFGYNVIEAAAPDGISGAIQVSSPALDLAGALGGLSTAIIDFGALGKDPCRVGAGSSLTPVGRGGLPPTASGLIRPEPNLREATIGDGEFPHGVRLAQASLPAHIPPARQCD